jgi:hypothetical protein
LRLHEILLVGDIDHLTYHEIMSRDDSGEWLEAIKSELQFMDDNKVWDLVDLPDEIKSVKNK